MGNKNYENKPNRGFRENVNPVDETAEPVEPVEPVVTEETVETEESVKTMTPGIVANCEKLNLRKSPLKDSDGANVITTLLAGAAVVINESDSTPNFYKVTAENGLEGYCMKQFIKLT